MNQHMIIGNLTQDPETGATESGINWCRFTVAVRKKYQRDGQPDADFIRVTAWRGLGDTCAKYLAKGRKVFVSGVPRANAWSSRDGSPRGQIEITAEEVEFLSRGSDGNRGPTDGDAPPERGGDRTEEEKTDPQSGMTEVETDELPF